MIRQCVFILEKEGAHIQFAIFQSTRRLNILNTFNINLFFTENTT